MTYYHRIVKIGDFYFIEKDRDNDFPKSYNKRIPIPFNTIEEAKANIDHFRSRDDCNYRKDISYVVWIGT